MFPMIAILIGMANAQWTVQNVRAQGAQSTVKTGTGSFDLSALPSVPRGKTTILGGEVQRVDLVRDELTLKVFGQRSTKILFDERTQVYMDGKKASLQELSAGEHASVQTVLDGTDVFALSIHMLSRLPEVEYQGLVLNFDAGTRELTVSSALNPGSMKLFVPLNTSVSRVGQPAFSSAPSGSGDLVRGSLVSIKLGSDNRGRGVANRVTVLATPGSSFVFSGNISYLDVHSGSLVLVDTRDGRTYHIFFNSARLPASQSLREGDHVRLTAGFDGSQYVAGAINIE